MLFRSDALRDLLKHQLATDGTESPTQAELEKLIKAGAMRGVPTKQVELDVADIRTYVLCRQSIRAMQPECEERVKAIRGLAVAVQHLRNEKERAAAIVAAATAKLDATKQLAAHDGREAVAADILQMNQISQRHPGLFPDDASFDHSVFRRFAVEQAKVRQERKAAAAAAERALNRR